MVHRRLRHVQSLIPFAVLVALGLLAVACAPATRPADAAVHLGFDPAVVVDLGTAALAPSLEPGGRVSIVAIREQGGEWVASPIASSHSVIGEDSLHLITYGGATGEGWNTFVYGTAAPGTVRVEVTGFRDQRGGAVVGGTWLIALREKELAPEDINWRFIADDGSVRTGAGIFPPDA